MGDIIWGSGDSRPLYITSHWGPEPKQTIPDTIWETGANAVSVSAAEHAGRRDATVVRKWAERFVTKVKITTLKTGVSTLTPGIFWTPRLARISYRRNPYMVVATQVG